MWTLKARLSNVIYCRGMMRIEKFFVVCESTWTRRIHRVAYMSDAQRWISHSAINIKYYHHRDLLVSFGKKIFFLFQLKLHFDGLRRWWRWVPTIVSRLSCFKNFIWIHLLGCLHFIYTPHADVVSTSMSRRRTNKEQPKLCSNMKISKFHYLRKWWKFLQFSISNVCRVFGKMWKFSCVEELREITNSCAIAIHVIKVVLACGGRHGSRNSLVRTKMR